MPIVLLPASETGEYFTWIDPAGVSHVLTLEAGYGVLADIRARWQAALSHAEHNVPGQAGARVTQTRRQPVTMDLPIEVSGESYGEVRGKIRNLASWLHTIGGPGVFRVTAPDESVREIEAYASYEVNENLGMGGDKDQDVLVSLYCPGAYWRDAVPTEATYTTGGGGAFLPASFPILLASTVVLASPTVTNGGDDEAWPVWTIAGPGTNPVLRNLTTGKATEFGLALGAGEQAIVDTRPGYKSVTDGQGDNLYQSLSRTANLWPLARGTNQLQIEMTAATAESSVLLSYTRVWLGP